MRTPSTKNTGLAILCALSLTACGSESEMSQNNINATPTIRSTGADNTVLVYDENTKTFVVIVNGVAQTDLVAETGADYGAMLGVRNAGGSKIGAYGQTDNSLVVVGGIEYDAAAYGGVVYARLGDTSMPTTGSAVFTGDYSGLWRRDGAPKNEITRRVHGDVTLAADFGASTISGAITNRALIMTNTNTTDTLNPLSDVTFNLTAIDGSGAFSGTTTGGEITNGFTTWYPVTGSYEGLISGPNAGEVVGAVNLNHKATATNSTFTEMGGFIGSK